jgi:hypothetical protein
MRKIDPAADHQLGSLKVRRDSIYCDGKIIARYDVEPSKGAYALNDMISVYSKSGKRVAIAFAPLFEPTCRILTENDQKEHFIQADPELKYLRIQQVVEFLLDGKYL